MGRELVDEPVRRNSRFFLCLFDRSFLLTWWCGLVWCGLGWVRVEVQKELGGSGGKDRGNLKGAEWK